MHSIDTNHLVELQCLIYKCFFRTTIQTVECRYIYFMKSTQRNKYLFNMRKFSWKCGRNFRTNLYLGYLSVQLYRKNSVRKFDSDNKIV